MKKIYIIPSLKAREIKPTAILTGSLKAGENEIVEGEISSESGIAAKESTWDNIWDE